MQRIKLLYIITKLELGGAQKQLLSLIRNLDRNKFQPILFTSKTGMLFTEVLSIPGLELKKSKFLERPINPLKDILALFEMFCFMKKNNFDIVHTHSSKAGILGRIAAKLAKVSYIIHTVHGWPFYNYQRKFWRSLFISMEREVAKFTDKIIVVSLYDKQKGLAYGIGEENKYALIRYGINLREFDKFDATLRTKLRIKENDAVVTNISCFKPQKSPLDFVQLAYLTNKKYPNAKFLLVGDGVLRSDIEKKILKFNLQDHIILTGWRRDIPEILSITDVLVLTSLWEGLPVSILEAMAAARPVVATNTGGIEEVVSEDKTGFLISPQNMETMSEKLADLLNNRESGKRMGNNARQSLDNNFNLDQMVVNTEQLYLNLN